MSTDGPYATEPVVNSVINTDVEVSVLDSNECITQVTLWKLQYSIKPIARERVGLQ